jgi:hypothetical protein
MPGSLPTYENALLENEVSPLRRCSACHDHDCPALASDSHKRDASVSAWIVGDGLLQQYSDGNGPAR